jgi:predicted transcriptional regulator
MMVEPQMRELLDFFKAMADANRLKIIGILAQQPSTVEQLAAMLELQASTVSHHLARLTQVGLVSARADSYYNVYQLETDALEAMAQRLLARETLPAVAAEVDLDAFDRKVLRDFIGPDGRLKSLPAQRKKLEAVLRYAVQRFEFDARYTERQVNEILASLHDDTAAMRRGMIEVRLMDRDHGIYWRVKEASGAVEYLPTPAVLNMGGSVPHATGDTRGQEDQEQTPR